MNPRTIKRVLAATPGHVILAFLAAIALFPIALVLMNSFKTQSQITQSPLSLPTSLNFENYIQAWSFGHFATGFINSLLLTASVILIVLVVAAPAAYVLAMRKIKFASGVMVYFMIAMTIPIQLFLFPLYAAFSELDLIGNVFAVAFIIAAVNLPIAILLLRTFFLQVPAEISEAGIVDGASTIQLLRHVMFPVVSPGLITVGTIVGLSTWNEFLISTTFLQGQGNYTATLGFLSMNGTFSSDEGVLMAGAAILIVPVMVIFIFAQRWFIDGLVTGSVKG
jgi:raffinose/stachyose/melibiose transport system permease protein